VLKKSALWYNINRDGGEKMNLDIGMSLIQEQKLVMTQEMQLSIKLLQMSAFEVQQFAEKELQENPVLDEKVSTSNESTQPELNYKELIKYFEFDNYAHHKYEKNDEEKVSPFNFISSHKLLSEYLMDQINDLDIDESNKTVCNYIIENIDEKGYMDESSQEIAEELKISSEIAKECIKIVQTLEPDGICARDLKECLKIQLEKKGKADKNINEIIDLYLPMLADNSYNIIARDLKITIKEAQEYGDIIKNLQPKPSSGFYTGEEVKYIAPDAYIKKVDNEFVIIMNDEILPRLTINNIYKEIIDNENDKQAVEYVKEKINSALFLIKSIEHRKSTIHRVLEKILELQQNYFKVGLDYLKPMTFKQIADSLGVHESTVSRAVRDKYIYTNNGTIKVKDLFTSAITTEVLGEDVSSNSIRKIMKELIEKEDKLKTISDQQICDELNRNGINISRRTVAKYREEMGIKSSKGRKRF
jgi:RNA polymerase sigma-54 factor